MADDPPVEISMEPTDTTDVAVESAEQSEQQPVEQEQSEGGEAEEQPVDEKKEEEKPEEAVAEQSTGTEQTAGEAVVGEKRVENGGERKEEKARGDSRRKFKIVGLRHPGAWLQQLDSLLSSSVQFHVWMERSGGARSQHKTGGVSVVYLSMAEAQSAWHAAQCMQLDGKPLKLHATKTFYDELEAARARAAAGEKRETADARSKPAFPPVADDDRRARTVYALGITSGATNEILESIFGADAIEAVAFMAAAKGVGRQAEVVMRSSEAAVSARQDVDGFELDDGEQQSTLRLLLPDEYAVWSAEPLPAPAAGVKTAMAAAPTQQAPVVEEEHVVDKMMKFVADERINWAEYEHKEDLYWVCDQVSGEFSGLPDSLLKPCLRKVLEKHLASSESSWMRQHIESLLVMWKKEMLNEHLFERESRVQMQTVHYSPPVQTRARGKKRAAGGGARAAMGVGALLQAARSTLATEDGEIDVDEDEYGNYMIGGEPLSFESWASQTKATSKPKQPQEQQPFRPKIDRKYQKIRREHQNEIRARKAEEKKIRIMRQGLGTEENDENKEKEAKELEEGEMDSEEEKKKAAAAAGKPVKKPKEKKKKKNESDTSSSSSSSSSSDDDDDDGNDARKRRRARRKQERKTGGNKMSGQKQLPPLLMKLFENRHAVFSTLPIEHKTAFVNNLQQIRSSGFSMTLFQQQQVMSQFGQAFQ